jgi:EAL domain-containing protein (putative c-di-GMP-specific phosphodiesterase class I)
LSRRVAWTRGRAPTLATLTLLALLATLSGVTLVTTVLERSLRDAARRNAAEEARLIVDIGFAGAVADSGRAAAFRRGAQQAAAARRSGTVSGVVVWGADGRVLFSDPPTGSRRRHESLPPVVRHAFRVGRRQIADSTALPGVPAGTGLVVAVPVTSRGARYAVAVLFSRRSLEHAIAEAKRQLYWLAGIGGTVMYLALLPILVRMVERLPRAIDRRREAELADLARGIAQGELRLDYQPQVATTGGEVVGVEALVRWEHPTRGLLGPAHIVPLAEESPLLPTFTASVLALATTACARWHAAGIELPVAVNVSPFMLASDELVTLVSNALEASGLAPEWLTLELTESALMEAGEPAIRGLVSLRAVGVRISIDDFGTGHSSLRRLASLPLDELKIDRSFVAAMVEDERVVRVVETVLDLGNRMELTVIAEGVESQRELDQLIELRCPAAQGFAFAAPMPEAELLAWLGRR